MIQEKIIKRKGEEKILNNVKTIALESAPLRKPDWIRIKLPHAKSIDKVKDMIAKGNLNTVCKEASCPNLTSCFSKGSAAFMIMGDICTRRCAFCDVSSGRPKPLDKNEPQKLAECVVDMGLKHVVITSVDRDDIRLDGGASHFAACIKAIRDKNSKIIIEVLVPDFKGCVEKAIAAFDANLPNIFNHNIETVERLYKLARPAANYKASLNLLRLFKLKYPQIYTKSGMMVGLGEKDEEIIQVMKDLRDHNVDMLTIGQYLAPSKYHMPVNRYVEPAVFDKFAVIAKELGFVRVASGPMVRSSYMAEEQFNDEIVR